METVYLFEDADTGDEMTLDRDATYQVISTYVDTEQAGGATRLVFTHRVRKVAE
jgi:hypothetical protein